MLWILLFFYFGFSLVWVRWRVWSIFFWPLYLIVSDEDSKAKHPVTFRDFARRTIPPQVVVPFSVTGPLFIPVSVLCWGYVGIMIALVRIWSKLRPTRQNEPVPTNAEG